MMTNNAALRLCLSLFYQVPYQRGLDNEAVIMFADYSKLLGKMESLLRDKEEAVAVARRKLITDSAIKKVIVDILVVSHRIIALKPVNQSIFIDNRDARKMVIWNTIPPDRINERVRGRLIGMSFKNALKLINEYGGISNSGEYGSMYLADPLEFIEEDKIS
jgi:hypothetical protein